MTEMIQQATQSIQTPSQLVIWLVIVFVFGGGFLIKYLVIKLFGMADSVTATNKELVDIVKTDLKDNNKKLDEVLKEVRR